MEESVLISIMVTGITRVTGILQTNDTYNVPFPYHITLLISSVNGNGPYTVHDP